MSERLIDYQRWRDDAALREKILRARREGGTWQEIFNRIAAAGYPPIPWRNERGVRKIVRRWEEDEAYANRPREEPWRITVTPLDDEGNEVDPTPANVDLLAPEQWDGVIQGMIQSYDIAPDGTVENLEMGAPDPEPETPDTPVLDDLRPAAGAVTDERGRLERTYLRQALRKEIAAADARPLLAEIRAEYKKLTERELAFRDELRAAIVPPDVEPIRLVNTSYVKHGSDLFVFFSDHHFGKFVDPASNAEGIAYNKQLTQAYLQQFVEEVHRIVRLYAAEGGVLNLHIIVAGDILDGSTMRPGQAWRVDMGIGEQKVVAARTLTRVIRDLARMGFAHTYVHCVVGNHGRVLARLDDTKLTDNHEWVLYHWLKSALEDRTDCRVTVDVEDSETFLFRNRGLVYGGEHGHRVPAGGDGSPLPMVQKRIKRLHESVWGLQQVDCYCYAHFHHVYTCQLGNGRWIVGNGCLDGGDDYTCQTLAVNSTSAQMVWLQHETSGITDFHVVRLAEPRQKAAVREVA